MPEAIPPQPNPSAPGPGQGPFPSGGSFGSTTTGGAPDWIIFGAALLLVAGVAEALSRINPKAGIGFALLVVLGYAASGGKLENAVNVFQQIGLIAGGNNGS